MIFKSTDYLIELVRGRCSLKSIIFHFEMHLRNSFATVFIWVPQIRVIFQSLICVGPAVCGNKWWPLITLSEMDSAQVWSLLFLNSNLQLIHMKGWMSLTASLECWRLQSSQGQIFVHDVTIVIIGPLQFVSYMKGYNAWVLQHCAT